LRLNQFSFLKPLSLFKFYPKRLSISKLSSSFFLIFFLNSESSLQMNPSFHSLACKRCILNLIPKIRVSNLLTLLF
jgi:hypothetical protein